MTPEEEERALRVELVKAVLPIMVQVAVMVVIVRRDDIARLAMRVRQLAGRQREREREETEVAVFRRQLAAWEHAEMGR